MHQPALSACLMLVAVGLTGIFQPLETSTAAETSAGPTAPEPGDLVRLGTMLVDPRDHTVHATGWVNLVEGPIELLACGPGGKTHETVFILDAKATDIHAALLLAGFKAGKPGPHLGTGPISGELVDVTVGWGETNAAALESFAAFYGAGAVENRPGFVFTGSLFERGHYAAAAEQSFLATFWDPWAILNLNMPEAGTNDEALVVNKSIVPPLGTPVSFSFRKRP